MKIYLSGSISGGRQKIQTYIRMKQIIESLGHLITSPQTADPEVTDSGESKSENSQEIFLRDMQQIQSADILLAEITIPSLGVGYEIATALQLNKPVLCLYDINLASKNISAMLTGNPSPLLSIKTYQETELDKILKHELENYQLYYFDDV